MASERPLLTVIAWTLGIILVVLLVIWMVKDGGLADRLKDVFTPTETIVNGP